MGTQKRSKLSRRWKPEPSLDSEEPRTRKDVRGSSFAVVQQEYMLAVQHYRVEARPQLVYLRHGSAESR